MKDGLALIPEDPAAPGDLGGNFGGGGNPDGDFPGARGGALGGALDGPDRRFPREGGPDGGAPPEGGPEGALAAAAMGTAPPSLGEPDNMLNNKLAAFSRAF